MITNFRIEKDTFNELRFSWESPEHEKFRAEFSRTYNGGSETAKQSREIDRLPRDPVLWEKICEWVARKE